MGPSLLDGIERNEVNGTYAVPNLSQVDLAVVCIT